MSNSKRRITITIDDSVSDEIAIRLIERVVGAGKISHNSKDGDFYCWATIYQTSEGDIAVYTSDRAKSPNVAFRVSKI